MKVNIILDDDLNNSQIIDVHNELIEKSYIKNTCVMEINGIITGDALVELDVISNVRGVCFVEKKEILYSNMQKVVDELSILFDGKVQVTVGDKTWMGKI